MGASSLVERAQSNIGHLNYLSSLRPGERPQITISTSPDSSRKFTITKYSDPGDGYCSAAWKCFQAAERKWWYGDTTRKDLDNLDIFLQDVKALVDEFATYQDLQARACLAIFQEALQQFETNGFFHYLASCLEGKPNAKPITPEEKQYRDQKTQELRIQLTAAAHKVKQATAAACVPIQKPETSGDGNLYVQRFLEGQCSPLEKSRDEIVRQGYQFLQGKELSLFTHEGVEVRIIHLTAEHFLQVIQSLSGNYVSLVSSTQTFPAIEFDHSEKALKLRQAGFQNTWESFVSNGKTYLVNRQDYEQIVVYLTHQGIDASKLKVQPRSAPSACAQPRTVVLKGGIYCHLYSFLMSQDAATMLAQGYNVLLFEDKHAKTFRIPSRVQVQHTVNALYAYLKEQKIAPEHILWKGTSLGSIYAMIGAATFSGTLGFADQGFATLTDTITDYACTYPMTSKWPIRSIVEAFLKYKDMDFNAATVLPQITGPFCSLTNKHDGLIQPAESERLASLVEKKGGLRIALDNPKIHHAEGWFKDPVTKAQVLRFLIESGFTPSPIM